jgi:hypothetical protein
VLIIRGNPERTGHMYTLMLRYVLASILGRLIVMLCFTVQRLSSESKNVFSYTPLHVGIWGNGSITPVIVNFRHRWK